MFEIIGTVAIVAAFVGAAILDLKRAKRAKVNAHIAAAIRKFA